MSEDNDIYREAPADIQVLARAIRERFLELKTQRLNLKRAYKMGERHDRMSHFTQAATLCKELGANPSDYVRACFEFCGASGGPFPNMIYGKQARVWWSRYKATYAEHLVEAESGIPGCDVKPFEVDVLISHMPEDQWIMVKACRKGNMDMRDPTMLSFFQDRNMPMEPWFRLFIFPNDERVWEEFSYPGKYIFAKMPDLTAYLRKLNPAAMFLIERKPAAPKPEWLKYDNSYD